MKQRDFGWLAECKSPALVDSKLLSHCHNSHDAIVLTWATRRDRGMSQAYAAMQLDMPKSHLSNILSGQKYLPDDLRIPFMWLCGSLALRQWEDQQIAQLGIDMEVMEAERKLNELKQRRAA